MYITHVVIALAIGAAWHVLNKVVSTRQSEIKELIAFVKTREERNEKGLTNFLTQVREITQRSETAKQQLIQEKLRK